MSQLISQEIPLASIKYCPVSVASHSQEIARSLEKASLKDDSMLPIHVAKTPSGDRYVVDGYLRVRECKKRGLESISAYTHPVSDAAGAVILHVRLHQSSPVNPLGLIDAANYLEKKGSSLAAVPRLLWLDPIQKIIVLNKMDPAARSVLDDYLTGLVRRFSAVTYPHYMIAMICKVPVPSQRRAVENIIRHMNVDCTRAKFSFPSAAQLEVLISEAGREPSKEPIVFSLDGADSEGPASGSQKGPGGKPPAKKAAIDRDLRSHLAGSRHEALLQCGCGNTYRVNMRTRSMSRITVRDDAVTIDGDEKQPVIMIPPAVAETFGAGTGDHVFFKAATAKQLIKILSKKSNSREKFLVCGTKRL